MPAMGEQHAICDLCGVRVAPHARVDTTTWEPPRVFTELQRLGGVSDDEMAKVFNLGIGMVVVVPPDDAGRTLKVLSEHGHAAVEIGTITPGTGQVHIT